MNDNKPSITDRLHALEQSYSALKNQNRSRKQEVSSFALECQQMRNQLLRLKKESDRAYNQIQSVQQRYQGMQSNFSNLQHTVQGEIQQIMEYDQKFLEQKKQTAYVNQQIADAKTYVQRLCDEREELSQQIRELQSQKNLLFQQKKELSEQRTRLQAQFQKHEGHIAAVRAKMQ